MLSPWRILDLFAGPGGWEQALSLLGRRDVLGIDVDEAACLTAQANGHARLRRDVYGVDPLKLTQGTQLEGLIASPVCTPFSDAGSRRGLGDVPLMHELIERMAQGDDGRADAILTVADMRSLLVVEPMRFAYALRPQWVALEQVPAVLPLWQTMAAGLQLLGYRTWAGVLTAERYGVPQTRERALLLAHLDHDVAEPTPTHSRFYARDRARRDPDVLPWVSMAEALGWAPGMVGFPRLAVGKDQAVTIGGSSYRVRDLRDVDSPAHVLTEKARSWSRWEYVNGNQTNSARRDQDEPAPTIHFGARVNAVTWQMRSSAMANATTRDVTEPAPTLIGGHGTSDRVWTDGATSVPVAVDEAAQLQTFPADYAWVGSRSEQFQQVGNAVPPLLGAHALAALGVGDVNQLAA